MTDQETQVEVLWTYEISTEKIPEFLPTPLGEKMRAEDVRVNPYVSITFNTVEFDCIEVLSLKKRFT